MSDGKIKKEVERGKLFGSIFETKVVRISNVFVLRSFDNHVVCQYYDIHGDRRRIMHRYADDVKEKFFSLNDTIKDINRYFDK
jgi:hypothetical protein